MPLLSPEVIAKIVPRIKQGASLIHLEPLIGGASAQALLLQVSHADGEKQKYLLRVHSEMDRGRNPKIANDEFNLLKLLHGMGLPVAEAHYLDETGEIYPHPYLVVEFIEGSTDFSLQNLPNFLQQSTQALANVHQLKQKLSAEEFASLNFLGNRAEHVLWWINYQPEEVDESLQEGRLRQALRTHFPLKQVNESTLLHGDFWAGNLIWRDKKLVGLIDWEDAELGDPLSDFSIARLDILWFAGQEAMQDFTRLYQALMPNLDYSNLPYWDLFTALRPANQLGDWVSVWAGVGRPDVTETTMRASHQWFIKQAFEQIG